MITIYWSLSFIAIIHSKIFFSFSAGLIFLTAFATINLLNLITCVSLIVGALQKKKNCLVPYLILTSIYILLYLGLGVYFFTKQRENYMRHGIVTIIVLLINIYCLIVVHQLYRLLTLREQNYPAFLRETNRQQQTAAAANYETTYVKIPWNSTSQRCLFWEVIRRWQN